MSVLRGPEHPSETCGLLCCLTSLTSVGKVSCLKTKHHQKTKNTTAESQPTAQKTQNKATQTIKVSDF